MTRLVFSIPGPETPGYLKRVHQALQFSKEATADNPEMIEKMVEFLAQYVTEPEERAEKLEALWMATENEFKTLLRAITGESEENPTR